MSAFAVGDLVEARKGETVVRGRVDDNGVGLFIDTPDPWIGSYEAEGFEVTLIERHIVLPVEPGTVIAIGEWWFVRLRQYQGAPSAWEMLPLPTMELKNRAKANGFADQCVYGDSLVLEEAKQHGGWKLISAPAVSS